MRLCGGRKKKSRGSAFTSTMLPFRSSSLVAVTALLLSAQGQEDSDGPPELFANVGDSVVFDCQLEFPNDTPIPYIIHWNKGGETVFTYSNGELTPNNEQYRGRVSSVGEEPSGAINLTSIREADRGWYECRIYFPNRTPSTRLNGTWFHLTVDAGSLIAIPPINVTTLEGETAFFSCITKPQPKDIGVKVTWYKDGAPLENLEDLKERSFVVDEGSLTIAPTSMEDPGEYACEVTAGAHRQQASAYLDVRYKAKVLFSPREINLPLGRPGSLDCHYRANPPLTSLRWEKDGFLFDPYNVQGVFYRKNGSLFFDRVDEDHQGRYTCTPFNDLGTEGPSPVMDVRVQKPPVFTATPHNMYLLRAGDSVEFPCDASDGSKSRPTIVWFKKDGTALPRGRYHLTGGNLTIAEVRDEDRGVYQCVASNAAGTISAETTLALENQAPRPPFNLRAVSASTSVTLSWQSGSERPPKTYSIWFRRTDSPEWRTLPVDDPDQTEVVVSNLRAGREYEFMVLSKDERGDGMFSKPIHVMTTGGFQHTGPPGNLSAFAEQGGLLLSWDPPAVSGDLVSHYVVRWWKKSADGEKLLGDVQTEDTRILLRSLDDSSLYWIQVIAVAGVGDQRTMNPAPRLAVFLTAPKATKAVSFGVGAIIVILVALAGGAYWARSRYRRRNPGSSSIADGSAASADGKTVLA